MGYLTKYSLYCDAIPPASCCDKKRTSAYCPDCGKKLPDDWKDIVIESLAEPYDVFEKRCTWYDWHKDMLCISKLYPYVLFELTGHGEESVDIWRCYFKHGKSQHCLTEITFEEFDESKFQELK